MEKVQGLSPHQALYHLVYFSLAFSCHIQRPSCVPVIIQHDPGLGPLCSLQYYSLMCVCVCAHVHACVHACVCSCVHWHSNTEPHCLLGKSSATEPLNYIPSFSLLNNGCRHICVCVLGRVCVHVCCECLCSQRSEVSLCCCSLGALTSFSLR